MFISLRDALLDLTEAEMQEVSDKVTEVVSEIMERRRNTNITYLEGYKYNVKPYNHKNKY